MKTLTLNIEDSKYGFILNLLKKYDFVQIVTKGNELTNKQKQIAGNRLDELISGKTGTIDWEQIKEMLR
jgi:hypothetical protein